MSITDDSHYYNGNRVTTLNIDEQGVGTSSLKGAVLDGTILSAVKIEPTPSVATSGVNYHKLVTIGENSGTNAYGFGDVTKPTTGLMMSLGRTTVATGNQTDTGLDVRVLNKLVNTGTNTLQGAYIKAKNYSTGTITNIRGIFCEVVKEGTCTSAIGIEIGSDGSVLDANIKFTNGAYLVALTTAITATSTDTTSPAGSIGFTTHATGVGKLFVSAGGKWVYMAVA